MGTKRLLSRTPKCHEICHICIHATLRGTLSIKSRCQDDVCVGRPLQYGQPSASNIVSCLFNVFRCFSLLFLSFPLNCDVFMFFIMFDSLHVFFKVNHGKFKEHFKKLLKHGKNKRKWKKHKNKI